MSETGKSTVRCALTGDAVTHIRHRSGLDIWVWEQPQSCSAYGVFATRYGSVYNILPTADGGREEMPAGIAHYLEHKLFESEDGSADERFAETGADANAYTEFSRTAYLFEATENIVPSLDILLDFVTHPYFTPETVEKERGIIEQEIRMGEDRPGSRILRDMLGGLYHRHPVRLDIAGSVSSIAEITAERLYRCYERYYDLRNMVLVVAGRITADEVIDCADRHLPQTAPPPAAPGYFRAVLPDEPDGAATARTERTMPVSAPLFYLGIKEPPAPADAMSAAGDRLIRMLIANNSRPLYERLMAQGLINHSFGAGYFSGPGFGTWLFGGESTDPDRVAHEVLEEIRRLQRDGVTERELEPLRRAWYGNAVSSFEQAGACAEILLDDLIYGLAPFSVLEALTKITPEEITRQLRRRLPTEAHTLSIVRPAT